MKEIFKKLKGMVFVLEVLFSACLISTKLVFMKFPDLIAWIESTKTKKHSISDSTDLLAISKSKLIAFIFNVTQFKYFVIRKNCFKKSLLFYYWLHRFGVKNVQLIIGAFLEDEKIHGHAWITINDEVFFDTVSKIKDYHITFTTGVNINDK